MSVSHLLDHYRNSYFSYLSYQMEVFSGVRKRVRALAMTGFSAVSTLKPWERWYETVVTTQNNLKSQVDATFIRRRARFKQVLKMY